MALSALVQPLTSSLIGRPSPSAGGRYLITMTFSLSQLVCGILVGFWAGIVVIALCRMAD